MDALSDSAYRTTLWGRLAGNPQPGGVVIRHSITENTYSPNFYRSEVGL